MDPLFATLPSPYARFVTRQGDSPAFMAPSGHDRSLSDGHHAIAAVTPEHRSRRWCCDAAATGSGRARWAGALLRPSRCFDRPHEEPIMSKDKKRDQDETRAPGSDTDPGDVLDDAGPGATKKLKKKVYEPELERLQLELVKMEDWVKAKGLRVVVLFEGRDAAGKGGVIKRIMAGVNPRIT